MSNTQFLLTSLFIFMAMGLSYFRKLSLERDILWSSIRAGVQLLLIGYVLHFIFASDQWVFTGLILLVMVVVASWNVAARSAKEQRRRLFGYVFLALLGAEIIGAGLLAGLHIIKTTPQYIIPISGMIIGNAMVVASLQWNRMQNDMRNRADEVKVLLSLGFSSEKASSALVKKTVQTSLIPTLDSMKTIGLVQLPGMMTGQIIAGSNPVDAVKYQILIIFTMTASSVLCSIILGFFLYRVFFTKAHQLRLPHA
jgi:putative ABC transport system permease protein